MGIFSYEGLEAVLAWIFVIKHMNFTKPLPSLSSFFSLMNFQLSFVPEGLISGLHNRLLPQLFGDIIFDNISL